MRAYGTVQEQEASSRNNELEAQISQLQQQLRSSDVRVNQLETKATEEKAKKESIVSALLFIASCLTWCRCARK